MINKQSIWFTFLFSIILVLSIFYVTMNENDLKEFIEPIDTNDTTLVVNESTEIVSLRIQNDEEVLETINNLQDIILSETSDLSAKNDAYNDLLLISSNKSDEQKLEKIIKDEFQSEAFVKINGGNVTIVIDKDEHDYELANKIIRRINQEFDEPKYVTVKFN
ncbi:MAG TPA: SpoIIIAH-like family protein [Candidatus Coprovivens excrementavium]|nr:SpoIIIAH-like family protein [Candidatus Coprovivens excrementavium]